MVLHKQPITDEKVGMSCVLMTATKEIVAGRLGLYGAARAGWKIFKCPDTDNFR